MVCGPSMSSTARDPLRHVVTLPCRSAPVVAALQKLLRGRAIQDEAAARCAWPRSAARQGSSSENTAILVDHWTLQGQHTAHNLRAAPSSPACAARQRSEVCAGALGSRVQLSMVALLPAGPLHLWLQPGAHRRAAPVRRTAVPPSAPFLPPAAPSSPHPAPQFDQQQGGDGWHWMRLDDADAAASAGATLEQRAASLSAYLRAEQHYAEQHVLPALEPAQRQLEQELRQLEWAGALRLLQERALPPSSEADDLGTCTIPGLQVNHTSTAPATAQCYASTSRAVSLPPSAARAITGGSTWHAPVVCALTGPHPSLMLPQGTATVRCVRLLDPAARGGEAVGLPTPGARYGRHVYQQREEEQQERPPRSTSGRKSKSPSPSPSRFLLHLRAPAAAATGAGAAVAATAIAREPLPRAAPHGARPALCTLRPSPDFSRCALAVALPPRRAALDVPPPAAPTPLPVQRPRCALRVLGCDAGAGAAPQVAAAPAAPASGALAWSPCGTRLFFASSDARTLHELRLTAAPAAASRGRAGGDEGEGGHRWGASEIRWLQVQGAVQGGTVRRGRVKPRAGGARRAPPRWFGSQAAAKAAAAAEVEERAEGRGGGGGGECGVALRAPGHFGLLLRERAWPLAAPAGAGEAAAHASPAAGGEGGGSLLTCDAVDSEGVTRGMWAYLPAGRGAAGPEGGAGGWRAVLPCARGARYVYSAVPPCASPGEGSAAPLLVWHWDGERPGGRLLWVDGVHGWTAGGVSGGAAARGVERAREEQQQGAGGDDAAASLEEHHVMLPHRPGWRIVDVRWRPEPASPGTPPPSPQHGSVLVLVVLRSTGHNARDDDGDDNGAHALPAPPAAAVATHAGGSAAGAPEGAAGASLRAEVYHLERGRPVSTAEGSGCGAPALRLAAAACARVPFAGAFHLDDVSWASVRAAGGSGGGCGGGGGGEADKEGQAGQALEVVEVVVSCLSVPPLVCTLLLAAAGSAQGPGDAATAAAAAAATGTAEDAAAAAGSVQGPGERGQEVEGDGAGSFGVTTYVATSLDGTQVPITLALPRVHGGGGGADGQRWQDPRIGDGKEEDCGGAGGTAGRHRTGRPLLLLVYGAYGVEDPVAHSALRCGGVCVRAHLAARERATARVKREGLAARQMRHQPRPAQASPDHGVTPSRAACE